MRPYLSYRSYRSYRAGAGGNLPIWNRHYSTGSLGDDATFSRASTAYHQQPDGTVVAVASDEARFSGMLRVSEGVYSATGLPGPFGVLMEPAATNLCLQSQAAGTTWTQTNITGAANSIAAPDGTTTADTLTAAASNATWVQTTTAASAQKTWSIWLKRKTGTGVVSMSLDGGSTYTAKTITTSWARYSITQTLENPSLVFKISTSADAVYVWGSQLETGAVPTSYIPTTTEAVTRAIDALAYSGVPADNETRTRLDNATNSDADDWNGTVAAPTVPKIVNSIKVYLPDERPI